MSMTHLPQPNRLPIRSRLVALFCLAGALAGCGQNDIRVYTVPKEKPSLATASTDAAPQPQVHWKLPAGWEEQAAGGMRLARFAVTGKDGHQADIAIIPLGAANAPIDQLVNIWREQIHLPPVKPEDLTKQGEKVKIGSSQGDLFELVSTEPMIDDKFKARSLIAILSTNGGTWVFKMSGYDDLVVQQKASFTSFLESISIDESAGALGTPPRFASTNPGKLPTGPGGNDSATAKPVWKVPAGWQEQPPSQMLLAKFAVGGDGAAKAEVTVSAFPGDTGGLLANVNRWRGQVGLANIAQSDLQAQLTPVDVAGGKAMLVDVTGLNPKTGQKARLIGAIIPREGRTWFFKMMGDEQLAEKEKSVFVKFIQTVQFPDA